MIPDSWSTSRVEPLPLSSLPLEPLVTREYDVDPAAVHERLRAQYGPVVPVDLLGVPVWFVIGYEEVLHILQNTGDVWSKQVANWRAYQEGRVPDDWPPLTLVMSDNTGFQDGERQRQGRAAWDAALRPYQDPAHQQTQLLDRAIERYCDELIDVMTQGTTTGVADLCAQYGRPLPLMVLNHLLGVTIEHGDDMVMDFWRLLDGPDSTGAYQRLYAALLELVTAKRRRRGEDFPSYMFNAKPDLTEEELTREIFMLPAFLDFTGSLICNAVVEVITNPRLRSALATGAIEEAVNRVALCNPAIANVTFRYAKTDVQLGHYMIAAGDAVLPSIAAANADPRFGAAISDDTVRSTRAHLAWGAGPHSCPSRRLATQLTTIAVRRLVERFSSLRLSLPPDQLPWRSSVFMRALRSLPVQYEVRQGFTPPPRPAPAAEPGDARDGEDRQPRRSALLAFLQKLRLGR